MVGRRYGIEKYVTSLQKLVEFSNFDVYMSSQCFKTNFTQNYYIGCVPTVWADNVCFFTAVKGHLVASKTFEAVLPQLIMQTRQIPMITVCIR